MDRAGPVSGFPDTSCPTTWNDEITRDLYITIADPAKSLQSADIEALPDGFPLR